MTDEVIEKIKDDLETAAYVDRLLPPVRAPKYRCCMPEIVYTPQEMISWRRNRSKFALIRSKSLYGNVWF